MCAGPGGDEPEPVDRLDGARRPAPPPVHLLPPGAQPRCPGRARAAHAVRPDARRRSPPRSSSPEATDGPAHRAGEAQDRRGQHPVPGPGRPRAARSARRRCSPSSTWCSPRPTTRRPTPASCGSTWPTRPSGSAGCWSTLMPDVPECAGLLALLLGHPCPAGRARRRRRRARAAGRPGPHPLGPRRHRRGGRLVERRFAVATSGPYQVQAAIACLHGLAPAAADTDWAQIAELYGVLERLTPTPVVRVNRAVAVAEADGPDAGLAVLDSVVGAEAWHHFHAARAELLVRSGRKTEAVDAFRRCPGVPAQRRRSPLPRPPTGRDRGRRTAVTASGTVDTVSQACEGAMR